MKPLIKYKSSQKVKQNFTLIELVTALGVFSVIMLVMMNMFSAAQKVWTTSNAKNEVFENANIALNLIETDLQGSIYTQNLTPFANFSTSDKIAFISETSIPPNDLCTNNTSEIQYKIGTGTTTGNMKGWIYRSAVGDKTTSGTDDSRFDYKDWASSGSTSIFNSAPWTKVIPYVTELKFSTYKQSTAGLVQISPSDTDFTNFPLIVIIKLTILDKNSWLKYESSGNSDILDNNKRTFTKVVYLGQRGQ